MTKSAVLLLAFNRPDTTLKVFEAIREARPRRLYIAADGPREDRPGEDQLCAEVRRIATAVDWNCKVSTLFQEQNLGCGRAVTQAITWFFDQEEEGIILEDDTLPDATFFCFCDELLARYRNDERIMAICGGSYFPRYLAPSTSYTYSRLFDPWGWATWRRAWNRNDATLSELDEVVKSGLIEAMDTKRFAFSKNWIDLFQRTKAGEIDTWDYQWTFSILRDAGFVIVPKRNLIFNLGFGDGATHTTDVTSKLASLQRHALEFPLKHPRHLSVAKRRDVASMSMRHHMRPPPLRAKGLLRSAIIWIIGERKWKQLRLRMKNQNL